MTHYYEASKVEKQRKSLVIGENFAVSDSHRHAHITKIEIYAKESRKH